MATRKNTKPAAQPTAPDGAKAEANGGPKHPARIPHQCKADDCLVLITDRTPPRADHNRVAWDQMLADIKAKLTVGAMVAAANERDDEYTANQGRYIGYAVRRGWVKVADA